MKVIFGYDIVTYNGVLPNCLNPKFIPTIYEASKFNYFKCRDYFIKKWNSIREICREIPEYNRPTLNKCINQNKTYAGFIWKKETT